MDEKTTGETGIPATQTENTASPIAIEVGKLMNNVHVLKAEVQSLLSPDEEVPGWAWDNKTSSPLHNALASANHILEDILARLQIAGEMFESMENP